MTAVRKITIYNSRSPMIPAVRIKIAKIKVKTEAAVIAESVPHTLRATKIIINHAINKNAPNRPPVN